MIDSWFNLLFWSHITETFPIKSTFPYKVNKTAESSKFIAGFGEGQCFPMTIGSAVVECLTQDPGFAGLSLSASLRCVLEKDLNPYITVSTLEDLS